MRRSDRGELCDIRILEYFNMLPVFLFIVKQRARERERGVRLESQVTQVVLTGQFYTQSVSILEKSNLRVFYSDDILTKWKLLRVLLKIQLSKSEAAMSK